ncbi:hypothetical protein JHK85_055774 [Glycine max]|uniref:V-ATPase proteolipid subunit C-like domain-containing protein n=1 Tax=Glycine max TaxID=3847 RepID=K7N0U1_SOYBN|nr:hypothetical protein JHK85_055774 [Glycine max]
MIQLCFGGFFGAMVLLDSIKLLQIVDLVLHINSGMGATYGTTKSGVGVASIGVMRSELVMKSIVPVVMAQLSSGLACGLVGLSAGMAIGIVGNAGVRMGRRESKHVYHHSNLWCCEDKVPTNKGWPNLIVTYL